MSTLCECEPVTYGRCRRHRSAPAAAILSQFLQFVHHPATSDTTFVQRINFNPSSNTSTCTPLKKLAMMILEAASIHWSDVRYCCSTTRQDAFIYTKNLHVSEQIGWYMVSDANDDNRQQRSTEIKPVRITDHGINCRLKWNPYDQFYDAGEETLINQCAGEVWMHVPSGIPISVFRRYANYSAILMQMNIRSVNASQWSEQIIPTTSQFLPDSSAMPAVKRISRQTAHKNPSELTF